MSEICPRNNFLTCSEAGTELCSDCLIRAKVSHAVSDYAIWQFGKKLFVGTFDECLETSNRWASQHGNIELQIVKVKESDSDSHN